MFHLFSIFTLRLGAAKQPDHAPQQSLVLDDGYPPAVEMSVDVRETPNVRKFARFVAVSRHLMDRRAGHVKFTTASFIHSFDMFCYVFLCE